MVKGGLAREAVGLDALHNVLMYRLVRGHNRCRIKFLGLLLAQ